MANEDRGQSKPGQPLGDDSRPQQVTYEHSALTKDQQQYLRRIQSSTSDHDRNLLMGGPRNKPAS
jgi:hypothetical protein